MRYFGLVATVLVTTSLAAPLPHPNDDGLSKRGFGDILSSLLDNKEEIGKSSQMEAKGVARTVSWLTVDPPQPPHSTQ